MNTPSVTEEIKAAFPLRPLPDMSLHQGQLCDYTMAREVTKAEWSEAARIDSGRTWEAYTDEELISCEAALSHLNERSFIYYLPAYLLLALRHLEVEWDHLAWGTANSAVFAVTHRSDYTFARFAQLSAAQISAIRSFLFCVARSSLSNAEDAQKALERYWDTEMAGELPHGP